MLSSFCTLSGTPPPPAPVWICRAEVGVIESSAACCVQHRALGGGETVQPGTAHCAAAEKEGEDLIHTQNKRSVDVQVLLPLSLCMQTTHTAKPAASYVFGHRRPSVSWPPPLHPAPPTGSAASIESLALWCHARAERRDTLRPFSTSAGGWGAAAEGRRMVWRAAEARRWERAWETGVTANSRTAHRAKQHTQKHIRLS
jgi:hypothetical protein